MSKFPEALSRMTVALAVALALQPALHAQSDETGLEEIVVTAQKREQRLIDVPIAVTALAGEALERRGITNVQGLEGFTPNLQISPTPGNSSAAQIAIRGSVTANPALTMEPAVGIYVDGVYVGKTQGALFDLIEIDRIEVLRGPQGTLWGRNTLSGAFNIVTRKPSGEAGGSATISSATTPRSAARSRSTCRRSAQPRSTSRSPRSAATAGWTTASATCRRRRGGRLRAAS